VVEYPNNDPTQPLIGHQRNSRNVSRKRRDSALRRDSLSSLLPMATSQSNIIIRSTISIFSVCALGTVGWFLAWLTGLWSIHGETPSGPDMPLSAEILGYISAVLYFTARIPQIILNHRKRSCEGKKFHVSHLKM
jgi:hypothetical protein